MTDAAVTFPPLDDPHRFTPRAQGALRISVRDGNRLDGLRQSGASKALFPRTAGPGLLAVMLNTAGGVTGGDRFATVAHAAPGSHLTLTTQTAERIYKAQPGQTARMTADLTIAAAGRIDWLPQETILFDRACLRRRLTVDMAADACFTGVETLVLGRGLMGERITDATLRDDVRITRDGVLVYADAITLTGAVSDRMAQVWCTDGAACVASIVHIAPDAAASLDAVRTRLPHTAGASLIAPGVLFVRLVQPDSFDMRRALIPILTALRGPLPPTWTL